MLERTARPLRGVANAIAGAVRAVFGALGTPGRYLADLLTGVWLGHSLHAVLVDVVIGAATAALLLDLLRLLVGVEGLETATTWVVGLAWLSAVGSIITGLTEVKDTNPDTSTRDVAVMHGLVNIVGTGGLAFSTMQRANGNHDVAFWGLLIGYLVLSVGGYIGGHVVYKHGYGVNVNAFSRGKRAAEFSAVLPLADLPDGTPTRASFGATAVVLVRRGEVVHALKNTCSHLGGPLAEGTLGDGTIQCPWHGSVFRLRDGAVVHGPATSRQISYRARVNGDQVEIQGPHD